MNHVPWDVQRHRDKHTRVVHDPNWHTRPTRIDADGVIRLQGFRLYRCVCGRQHLPFTSKVCPCGEPFPYGVAFEQYRGAV